MARLAVRLRRVREEADAAPFDYTGYTFTFIASGSTATIGFEFRNLPAYFSIDEVSVVPEPALLLLSGFGLAAAMTRARLRRRGR